MASTFDVTSISTTRADCPGIEKETLTTGSCRDGFSLKGSFGIMKIPSIIRQAKERIIEKEETFIAFYDLM
jgi:hypothetical protein